MRWFMITAVALAAQDGTAGLAAQTGAVTGVVTDAANGHSLVEAAIDLVGTGEGRFTDAHGRYLIGNVPGGEYTVRVRMPGYGVRTMEVTVSAGSTAVADFQLEVGVTGQAGICPVRPPERKIGVSLPAVCLDPLGEAVPPGGLGQILEGRIPGVRSIGTNGGIGAGRELRIRGTDSFGYTRQRPMVLVDGVRIDMNKEEWGADMKGVTCCDFSGGAGLDRLTDFNPEEIDRVEVLKGPAAAALFGTEGSAGVIKVFTKRGRSNTPAAVTVNAGLGFNRLRANLPTRLRPRLTGQDGLPLPDPNQYLIENGPINDYGLTVQGGGGDVTYFVAGGFANEEGSVKPNDRRRANLRVNLDLAPSQKLHVGVTSGRVRNRIRSLQSHVYGVAVLYPTIEEEGAPDNHGFGGVTAEGYRAIRIVSDTDRWTGRVQVTYSPGPGFTHQLTLGADRVSEEKTRTLPQGRYYTFLGEGGERNAGSRESRKYTLDFLSTYDYASILGASFASGSLAVGGQAYWDEVSTMMVTGRGFPEGGRMAMAAAERTFVDDTVHEERSRGVFVLNRLDLGDNLSLTAAVRVDEHPALGDSAGAQVYPKANVAYTVPGPVLPAAISRVRFRGAYGLAGKPPPRSTEREVFDSDSREYVTVPANWDLEPEKKREVEAGIDIGLLNERIGVELTYYDALVLNGLYPQRAADPVEHFRPENSMEIMNRGFEAAVAASLVDGPALSWNMNVTYEWNRNRIISLGPDALDDSMPLYRRKDDGFWEHVGWRYAKRLGGWWEREPLDNIYYYGLAGYDREENRHKWTSHAFFKGLAQPMHMGSIFSRVRIGNHLGVSFQFRGEVGASMQNWDRWYGVRITHSHDEYVKHLDDRGRPTFKADSVQDYHNLRVVDKRDHIRLQEVSLSYTVPKGMAGMLGLGRTTVTLSGYNLHWWDDCNCQDPNAKRYAADTGGISTLVFIALPQPRRFLMSIRTRF